MRTPHPIPRGKGNFLPKHEKVNERFMSLIKHQLIQKNMANRTSNMLDMSNIKNIALV